MRPVLLMAVLGLVPGAATAADAALEKGAHALTTEQRDFDAAQSTWAWERDGKRPAPNAAGLVALGLVRAYERTGSRRALGAAEAWAAARAEDLEAWRTLYDPDIEALAALGRATGQKAHARVARAAFERRWGEVSGEEAFARIRMVRSRIPAVVGYDAALALRAALAVGRADFARELAAKLAETSAWDVADEAGTGMALTSRAAVLGALAAVDARAHGKVIARLALGLISAQGEDGSWGARNTQATAYAVTALGALGDLRARKAAERGAGWLVSTQLSHGAWATFHDGLPEPFVGEVVHEVTAEALVALAARPK